jgi:hypothetical protein
MFWGTLTNENSRFHDFEIVKSFKSMVINLGFDIWNPMLVFAGYFINYPVLEPDPERGFKSLERRIGYYGI